MLPKRNRIKKRKDFERIFRHGKEAEYDGLLLKVKASDQPFSRFGFIVSNKVSKKAVVRNRIRRQLHEVVRKLLPEIKTSVDGVFITRPGFQNRDLPSLEKTVWQTFRKANLIT